MDTDYVSAIPYGGRAGTRDDTCKSLPYSRADIAADARHSDEGVVLHAEEE